jgi:hypothetical protein
VLARHLSHTSAFFCLRYFFNVGSYIFAQGWPQTVILLSVASYITGITGVYHHSQFID